MEEIETWRDVPDYEGLYLISNLGRVKSLPRGKQWTYRQTHNDIRKPRIKNGYYCVNLSKNNEVKWISIHRLVAMAFIPNPNNYPCVNHKDEDRLNNKVILDKDGNIIDSNLEWCTHEYNCNYGTARERQKTTRANNPNDPAIRKLVGEKNSRAVKCFSPSGELVAIFKSLTEASEKTGMHISQISRHCNGRVGNDMNRPIRKYRFEYA